jgi:hypothetical protein
MFFYGSSQQLLLPIVKKEQQNDRLLKKLNENSIHGPENSNTNTEIFEKHGPGLDPLTGNVLKREI